MQVKTAVVIAWETPTHEKRLVAYLQPAAGTLPEGDDLRAFLQQTLPEPMIPSTFIQLDALPLTANGKVDRRALPNPDPYVATGHREYVAPRDKIEVQLVHIWESVLETKPIGVLDSFFSLGGHSLLAVRLISQIEQALGQSLTLTDLFQGETIAALAQKLRQKRESKAANLLVPIQTKGEKRPLFFIHPSGGSVHWYMLLANYLGEERPFYGIQAQGMNGEQLPHDNLKTMAADYIALIRSTQPDGPFLIGSWSLGVIIAFEIARQLTAAGEEVTALIMLDQGPDLPHEEPEDEAEYLMDTFGKNVPLSLDRLRTMTPDKQIAHVFHEAQKVNWIMPDLTLAQFHLFVRMMQTHTAAWRDYVPQPYPGKIALFRADEQASANGEPDMGWSSLVAGGVTIIPVPGDHITMLQEPHVQVLADRLRNCLAEAEPVTVHEDQEIGRWEIRD
ncbi:MAG: thioesterase domain-containing protein [Anaerolineae bacterium]